METAMKACKDTANLKKTQEETSRYIHVNFINNRIISILLTMESNRANLTFNLSEDNEIRIEGKIVQGFRHDFLDKNQMNLIPY
jgi:hypothetical protein